MEMIFCPEQLSLPPAHQYVLITDEHIASLHAPALLKKFGLDDIPILTIPPGEQSKTRAQKERLEDLLSAAGCGRDSVIIALGGGVVTDLAGFVAATFCRGIPYVSIPTSLLGMVDAAIGGKVGVNTSYGKNLIGAFHPPMTTLIDVTYLDSLPHSQFLSGYAEVIKYGLIASPRILEGELPEQIQESCRVKQDIVEKDPKEKGLRRMLNFGHTVGHALEVKCDFALPHGYAVAEGMRHEAALSHRLGYLTEKELEQVESILKPFPKIELPPGLIEVMCHDKKSKGGQPRFVILQSIGKVVSFDGAYCTPVENGVLEEVLYAHCY